MVDISSYNSNSNKYTIPSDGYLSLNSGQNASGGASIVLYDSAEHYDNVAMSLNASGTYTGTGLFVRKGMKAKVATLPTGFYASFLPLI